MANKEQEKPTKITKEEFVSELMKTRDYWWGMHTQAQAMVFESEDALQRVGVLMRRAMEAEDLGLIVEYFRDSEGCLVIGIKKKGQMGFING
jgi:hypothetical protein